MGKKRSIASCLCLLIIIAVVSSVMIMIHEADHDCSKEACPICALLAVFKKILDIFDSAGFVKMLRYIAATVVFSLTAYAGKDHKKPSFLYKIKMMN